MRCHETTNSAIRAATSAGATARERRLEPLDQSELAPAPELEEAQGGVERERAGNDET